MEGDVQSPEVLRLDWEASELRDGGWMVEVKCHFRCWLSVGLVRGATGQIVGDFSVELAVALHEGQPGGCLEGCGQAIMPAAWVFGMVG